MVVDGVDGEDMRNSSGRRLGEVQLSAELDVDDVVGRDFLMTLYN